MHRQLYRFAISSVLAAALAACHGGASPPPVPPESSDASSVQSLLQSTGDSVLNSLAHERVIGSTVDPKNGDLNPYGLDIAKVSSGQIDAGDLVVCNFNDSANVQGTGTSIVALHPAVGAVPRHIVNSSVLDGCNALAMSPAATIWAADFSANNNPIIFQSGTIHDALSNGPWHHPFGEAFVPPVNSISVPAFYVSNAGDGSLVRIYVFPGPRFAFSTIVKGFPVNGGAPGSILSPSGLNYQKVGDRLYVVDGTNNALYAIDNISKIEPGGITVNGMTFSGKFAADAHVIYSGAPLNGPISSALLWNGNIVVGNTLDPNGQNLMVEISPSGHVLAVKNVDTGASGSIFGMVAAGTSTATTHLYFNDDNANAVEVLEP
ncbi:MAG TPA: hypothetical protein VFL13_03915 [Candidatus Baltobacteraceae bacterium]|nr:hypothetical protein [Candidatus Baltobacteraceae bacterium]